MVGIGGRGCLFITGTPCAEVDFFNTGFLKRGVLVDVEVEGVGVVLLVDNGVGVTLREVGVGVTLRVTLAVLPWLEDEVEDEEDRRDVMDDVELDLLVSN